MLRFYTLVIFFCVTMGNVVIARADGAQYDPGSLISVAREDLDEIRALVSEMHKVDDDGGWLSRTRNDVQADLDQYLDALIDAIVSTDYQNARQLLLEGDARIADIVLRIDTLRIELLTAVSSEDIKTRFDSILMREYAPGSREAIQSQIDQLEEELAAFERDKADIERDFVLFLDRKYQISLTREQARSILYQINGRSIVEASITFSVLQKVEKRLGEIRETVTSHETLRRYYGIAAVMRLVAVRLHEQHLLAYRQEWLPALSDFEAENTELILETQELLASATSDPAIDRLKGNLEVQEQISDVIEKYRLLLHRRERIVDERHRAAAEDATLAVNTLRTLNQAVVLYDQFTSNQNEFDALMTIQNTELIPLENKDLASDFLDISRKFAAGS